MAGPNVSHVDLSETFYEWLDITNNVVTLVNKGVYIDGIPTDPNANVIIDGSLSVHQFNIANNNPRFYLKNGNNVNLGYIGYDQSANTIEIFSVAANTSLRLYANGIIDTNTLGPILDNIAKLSLSNNQLIYHTGNNEFATSNVSTFGRSLIDDADAAAARTTLGTAIGTNVQAYDAGLQSISGLTTSADQMLYTTGSDTYATTPLTSFARTLLDDANSPAARTTLGAQASDAGLTSISGLTTSADQMLYTTGSDTYATTSLSSYSRGLLGLTSAASWEINLQAFASRISQKSSNYTIQNTESGMLFIVDASGGNVTISLPIGFSTGRFVVEIKKIDTTFNTVTIKPDTGQMIDNQLANKILVLPYQSVVLANNSPLNSWYTVCESGTSYYNVANQYIRHSSGIQEAWGRVIISFSAANASTVVNFPANFVVDETLNVFTVLLRDGDGATTSNFENHAGNYSENSFTFYARNNGGSGAQSRTFAYRAIGKWF